MKKVFLWILGIVVVLVVAVTLVVMFHLGGIIKTGVETMGPKFTGTSVTLEKAYLRPLTGKAKLSGLVVGNPEGFRTPSAIRLAELNIKLDMASLRTDTIVIERILIDGPEITYEGIFGRNNLKAIMKNVEAHSPAEKDNAPETKESPQEQAEPGKKVVIRDLLIRNGKIGISGALMAGKQLSIPLPEIHLTGLGEKSSGLTAAEAISLVMDAIMKSASSALGSSGELAGKGLKVLGDSASAALGAAGDLAGGALDTVGAAGVSNVTAIAGNAAGALNDGLKSGGAALGGVMGNSAGALNDGLASGGAALGGAMGKGASVAGDGARKLGKGVGKLTGGILGGSRSKDDKEKEEEEESE